MADDAEGGEEADTRPAAAASPEAIEHRATNLELFLDLAFVFAVAQLSVLFAGDLTVGGLARGALVAWLVWWLWSQFAWLGTAIDLERPGPARLLVLAAVPPTLLLATAIPGAYGDAGIELGGAYLVVQLWALAVQGWSLWGDPRTRGAWVSYAPVAAVAPTLVLAGGLASGDLRVGLWVVAGALDLVASLLAGRQRGAPTEWRIDAGHFAERHALFVIIVLGEVLVACGVAASAVPLTPAVGAGVVAAVTVACVLWWAYFGFVAAAVERALSVADPVARGRVARDLCSYGHFPIVLGIALYALVAKHAVADPGAPLPSAELAVLAVSVGLVVGGYLGLHWQVARRVAPERPVAVAAVLVVVAVAGAQLPSAVLLAVVAAVLAVMQAVTTRRVTGGGAVPAP